VGRADHCKRVARGTFGEPDLSRVRERPPEQSFDSGDSCGRKRELSLPAPPAHRASRARRVSDEHFIRFAAVRATRQMRQVTGKPQQLQLKGERQRLERRTGFAWRKLVEEIEESSERGERPRVLFLLGEQT